MAKDIIPWAKVTSSNVRPEKLAVIHAQVEAALEKGQPIRKIEKDIFFKFKVKINLKEKPQTLIEKLNNV